jgi:hypothetical protein
VTGKPWAAIFGTVDQKLCRKSWNEAQKGQAVFSSLVNIIYKHIFSLKRREVLRKKEKDRSVYFER